MEYGITADNGGVSVATLMLMIVLIVVLVVIGAFYKEWKITTFDPALATSIGIPVLAYTLFVYDPCFHYYGSFF